MAKKRPTPPLPAQLQLFTPDARPADRPPPIPAPRRVADTVTETLPDELLAAGWRIVWLTAKYDDGWFYAVNDQLKLRTAEHIYVKHRGFKYTLRDIAQGKTTPMQE